MTEEVPNKGSESDGEIRSTISRPWLVRIVVITLMLAGYGVWSLYDAYVSYPKQGADYASWAEWQYLTTAKEANENPRYQGILNSETAVADPVAELARLRLREVRERLEKDSAGSTEKTRASVELMRASWLTALSRIGRLHPVYTTFYENPDPVAFDRLRELEAIPRTERSPAMNDELRGLTASHAPQRPSKRWEALNARWISESQPGMLQSYDIPVNKAAAVGCFGFSLYLIGLFIRVATRTYTWNPGPQRLSLPSGEPIVPADLADIDKRKWDKFIVFLVLKDTHASLGGAEIKVDTYRHGLVEGWILEMEKTAFPERAAAEQALDAASRVGEADAGATGEGSEDAVESGAKGASRAGA